MAQKQTVQQEQQNTSYRTEQLFSVKDAGRSSSVGVPPVGAGFANAFYAYSV